MIYSTAILLAITAAFDATPSTSAFDVKLVQRSEAPEIAFVDGNADFQQVFNAAWVEASPATKGKSGLIARTQNCAAEVGGACVWCGGSQEKASILTFSEHTAQGYPNFHTIYISWKKESAFNAIYKCSCISRFHLC